MYLRIKITLVFSLFFSMLFAKEYMDNETIVREYYPKVYKSIDGEVQKRWESIPDKRAKVFEEQIDAFLSIAESKTLISEDVLTNAILLYSLPNERENNLRVIEDLSITNPFPDLMCDWINVKYEYLRSGNKLQQKKQKEYRKMEDEDYPFRLGFRLGLGTSNMAGIDKVKGVTSKNGTSVDLGFIFNYRKNNFFLQSEVSIGIIFSEVKKNGDSHRLNQGSTYFQLHGGFYKYINDDTRFILGIGGFCGYISTTTRGYSYDYDYRNTILKNGDDPFYPEEEDFKNLNYGVSALVGIEYQSMQFSIVPSLGLADLSKDGLGFKTRGIMFSAAILFP